MIEDLPKLIELGALGFICFILIFKGIDKMQILTDSIKNLTDNLEKLTDSVNKLQTQNEVVNQRLNLIENRLNGADTHFKNLEDLLRDIKFDLEHFKRGD